MSSHEEGLTFLVDWYVAHREDDWSYGTIPAGTYGGINIRNIGNPGWAIDIPLEGTELEGIVVDWVEWEASAHAWMFWRSTGTLFEARCGASDLDRALRAFKDFAQNHAQYRGTEG
jgi:hypothetical protein